VPYRQTITVPNQPSTLTFTYEQLDFDAPSHFMNDAFEASLVDAQGNPLVLPIAGGRDAFFNINENQPPTLNPKAKQAGTTVSVDLAHIPAATQATLELRLVNNDDTDPTSSVTIDSVSVVPGSLNSPVGAPVPAAHLVTGPAIDFTSLSDVTDSIATN